MFRITFLLTAFLAFSSMAGDLSHLKEIEKGQLLSGQKLKAPDLKGKVILFEYWAFN